MSCMFVMQVIVEKLRMEGNVGGRNSKCGRSVFVRLLGGSWSMEVMGCCHIWGKQRLCMA